jgi:cobalamin biosynthesis protein CobT
MYTLPIESEMEVFARTYGKDTGINILLGDAFRTDGKSIWVVPASDQSDPWIRFEMEVGVYHETGHIITGDIKNVQTIIDKAKAFIHNVVRDVVVEHYMETKYPGMKKKWAKFLSGHVQKHTNDQFQTPGHIFHKILILLYLRCRERLLGRSLGLVVPPTLQELFDKKLSGFIQPIINHSDLKRSLELTEEIFKILNTDEFKEEKKPSEPNQGGNKGSKKSRSSNSDDQDVEGSNSSGSNGESSEEDQETGSSGDEASSEGEEGGGEEPASEGDHGDNSEAHDGKEIDDATKKSDTTNDGGACSEISADDGKRDASAGDHESGKLADYGSSGNSPSQDLSDDAKKALDGAREDMEDPDDASTKTIADEVKDEVNTYAEANHIYREKIGLKDQIEKPGERYGWENEVSQYEAEGRKMTGYTGSKMKILFVSERAPHIVRNLRSGKLDSRRVYRLKSGSLDIFKRKDQGCYEDSAVYLVADHSSSMNGMKKLICQSILTCVASDLDKMRIPFGAVGFTIDGSCTSETLQGIRVDPCILRLMKDFEEPYRRVRNRFVWPSYTNLTAELPAIQFAAKRLASRRETKKVLFILTDGCTETGCGQLDASMRQATKEFIDRLLRAGVKVVPIGIMDRSMRYYCPDFIYVNDLDKFATEFYGQLMKLLL